MDYAYIVSGLSVGLLVGLTGVDGGSLKTRLLMILFGFAPTTAVGTDLLRIHHQYGWCCRASPQPWFGGMEDRWFVMLMFL